MTENGKNKPKVTRKLAISHSKINQKSSNIEFEIEISLHLIRNNKNCKLIAFRRNIINQLPFELKANALKNYLSSCVCVPLTCDHLWTELMTFVRKKLHHKNSSIGNCCWIFLMVFTNTKKSKRATIDDMKWMKHLNVCISSVCHLSQSLKAHFIEKLWLSLIWNSLENDTVKYVWLDATVLKHAKE